MAATRSFPEPRPGAARLVVALRAALERIDAQIERGCGLEATRITNEQELDEAWRKLNAWSDLNTDLLKRLVDSESLASDYEMWRPGGVCARTLAHGEVPPVARRLPNQV